MDGSLRRLSRPRRFLLGLAVALVLPVAPAFGQHRFLGRPRVEPCPPPPYCPPTMPTEPGKKPESTPTEPPPAPLTFEGGPAVRGATMAYATPSIQGDQLGIPAIAFGPRGSPRFPPAPGQVPGAVVVPSVRSFKIAENDSPFPRDRVYFGYNYYHDVNRAVNRRIGSDLEDLRVGRGTFGLEKTFLDGNLSLGFRLPLDTLRADSLVPGLGGQATGLGNLSIILKAALWGDLQAGRVVTTGLAVTAPTGPDRFAGYDNISAAPNVTILQPFAGAVWVMGDFFVHGFTALDVPTNSRDVTMFYNDVGVGWFLYRNEFCDSLITAITPTFEVHVNTPLSHRGVFRAADSVGTPDVIALTSGVTFEINRRATLAVGVVTPVTGPRPFDWEVLAQLNVRFGAAWGRPGVLGN